MEYSESSSGAIRRADQLAMRQCERAGYSGVADPVGTRHCVYGASGGACRRWQIERSYTCTVETKASSLQELTTMMRMDPYAAPQR